jgi:hypothetical protein
MAVESESKNRTGRFSVRFAVGLLVPIGLAYLLAVGLPMAGALGPWRDALMPRTGDPTSDSLLALEAFLTARLDAAGQDAPSLSVDLATGVLDIEIRGTVVRRCRIQRIELPGALERGRKKWGLAPLFSVPFVLQDADATILRAPVRVVQAPRDSTEARNRPPLDVPVETQAAELLLRFDRGLTLHIVEPAITFSDRVRAVTLAFRWRLREAARSAAELSDGRWPVHQHLVRVRLDPGDARAIFRALPDDARLALRL